MYRARRQVFVKKKTVHELDHTHENGKPLQRTDNDSGGPTNKYQPYHLSDELRQRR